MAEPGTYPDFDDDTVNCQAGQYFVGPSLEDLLNQLCAHLTSNYLMYFGDVGTGNFGGQTFQCSGLDYLQSSPLAVAPKVLGNYICDAC